jgi:hypothetical protein
MHFSRWMKMELAEDSQTIPINPSPQLNRLLLVGVLGCFLTLFTAVSGALYAWFTTEGVLFYYNTFLVTRVSGYALIGVGFLGFWKKHGSSICLVSTLGFIVLAAASAFPSLFLFELVYSFTERVSLTYATIRFVLSGIGLVSGLTGAIGIFQFRERTAHSKGTLLTSLCFLAWGVAPIAEAVLYLLFYGVLVNLPYSYAVILYIGMVYVPISAGSFLGMLLMWMERIEN